MSARKPDHVAAHQWAEDLLRISDDAPNPGILRKVAHAYLDRDEQWQRLRKALALVCADYEADRRANPFGVPESVVSARQLLAGHSQGDGDDVSRCDECGFETTDADAMYAHACQGGGDE